MGNKRILYLTVNRHWFDLIATGVKKRDYRQMKVYWYERLFESVNNPKHYDQVVIRNGYQPISPVIRLEYKGVDLVHSQTQVTYPDGTVLIPGSSYAINLGEILEIKNWHGSLERPKKRQVIFLKDLKH
ncbi:hypothetical protein [Reichenbachiella sp.]|uniref:hypothetical protein n=1 Tax=Reichenbachiella sp. TaxID=2184521 RepID=UPI003B5BC7FF